MRGLLAAGLEASRCYWDPEGPGAALGIDEQYATRVCISVIIGEQWKELKGWGIGPEPVTPDEECLLVRWQQQMVYAYRRDHRRISEGAAYLPGVSYPLAVFARQHLPGHLLPTPSGQGEELLAALQDL